MLTNSQKEHLTYTAIGQIVTCLALWVWSYYYIIPGISAIDLSLAWANASIEKYQKTDGWWLAFEEITRIIDKRTEYAELLKIMNTDIDNTRKAIVKTPGEAKYIDWLKKVILNSSEDKDILSQQKKILNSIIPTLSPISGNIEEENIDLKSYIRFMESKIFKQFNIDGTMVLGLQWIVPWSNTDWIPSSIGSFEIQLAFKWKNKDITSLITFINNSGDPILLTGSGTALTKLLPKDKIPAIMSNPLITVSSFNLESAIDPKKPNDDNAWRVTLRLYFRWISKDDIAYLKESIKVREESLIKNLEASITECKGKWPLCWETSKRLDAFSRKFQEYKLGATYTLGTWNQATDQISLQAQKAKVLKSLEGEYVEIVSDK